MTTPDIIILGYLCVGGILSIYNINEYDSDSDIKTFGYVTIWPLILLFSVIGKAMDYFESDKKI